MKKTLKTFLLIMAMAVAFVGGGMDYPDGCGAVNTGWGSCAE